MRVYGGIGDHLHHAMISGLSPRRDIVDWVSASTVHERYSVERNLQRLIISTFHCLIFTVGPRVLQVLHVRLGEKRWRPPAPVRNRPSAAADALDMHRRASVSVPLTVGWAWDARCDSGHAVTPNGSV